MISKYILLSFITVLSIGSFYYTFNSQDNGESLNIMIIGDYGSGNSNQTFVAEQFNTIAKQEQAEFVLGVGDNFYEPDGVTGVEDKSWDTHWANVYQTKDYLKNLNWYGVLGNHDYGGSDIYAEFKYDKYGWVIEDFFWAHTEVVAGKSVAFIHIDTNFLAYGIDGQPGKKYMKQIFEEQGWTSDEQMLGIVEGYLLEYQNYDWVIVLAHHQIGYACPKVKNTDLLYGLFQKYKVDVYLSGHSHQLSYTNQDDLGFILSGAGTYSWINECAESDPIWSKGNVFGFFGIKIRANEMDVTAYYIDDQLKGEWKEKELPPFQRRIK